MTESLSFGVKKKLLTAALMTVLFIAAMSYTVTLLALPTIVRELAGFELMNFVFSAYMLMSAITTPLYGRLADLFGRTRTLSVGIIIFTLSCVLCGFAQTMPMLIVFRMLQGIGGGAIFTLAFTIAGDAFPIQSRGIIMGALTSVWAIATLVGPLLGGVLLETLSWHWVFFINLPFGVLGLIMLNLSLQEHVSRSERTRQHAGFSSIFSRTTVLVNAAAFLACISMIGVDVYIILYLQTVLGYPPMIAGLSLLPMMISWVLISYVVTKLLAHYNAKLLALITGLVLLLCNVLLISLNASSSLALVIFYTFLMGIGLGGILNVTTIIIQESVGYHTRGTAMGINSFVKSISQAIGISFLGLMLNARLGRFFEEHGISGIDPTMLLQTGNEAIAYVAGSTVLTNELVVSALATGINLMFWIMGACSTVLVLLILCMPSLQLGAQGHRAKT
jgi:MFS family permease